MKVEELQRELAKDEVRPAYLLAGDEPLLRDDALAAIRAAVLEGGADDFNAQRLAGSEATPSALEDAVRTLPVMARRRLVWLVEPDQGRGAAAKKLLEALATVLDGVKAQSECVLVVTSRKPDRRQRWVKAFSDPAAAVDCVAPTQTRSILAFVRAEAKRQDVEIGEGAAELLVERIGPQLLLLRQELQKTALLAGVGRPVERSHVEASTNAVAEQPIWDLTDAIGEGRLGDALELLAKLQGSGAAAPVILGTLASHFRKLTRVRCGGEVAGPPFVVRKLEGQARRYTPVRLRACLGAIHDTDAAIKGAGALPPDMALERLVIGLAG